MSTSLISLLQRDEPSPSDSPYGYLPVKWICILFIALYSCTSLVHIAQAIRYRYIIQFSTPQERLTRPSLFFSQDVAFTFNCGSMRHRRDHRMEWAPMDVVQSAARRSVLYGV